MSLISTYGSGIRYLDNLVTLIANNDGICYSGFARIFDGTQIITFPLIDDPAYYLVYYDYSVNEYVQELYSTTFSKTGTFSNFIVWDRMLNSIELGYINRNIEFLYISDYNVISVESGAPLSLKASECKLWVPMLPTEDNVVQDYISKSNATISNYSASTLVEDQNIGPQLFAYSDTMQIDTYKIFVRDNIIKTNLTLPRLEQWTVEEVVDGNHLIYVYNYNNSTVITYLNGDAISLANYLPVGTELEIGNTTFEGGATISNVVKRGSYVIYNVALNPTQVKDAYSLYLLKDNALTLKEGTVVLTTPYGSIIIPLVYNPLVGE